MDRRKFVSDVVLWSAGIAAATPLFTIDQAALAAESAASTVAVAQGKDYAGLVAKALEPLGGMGAFIKKGMKVVVKPNIGFDRNVAQGACTHPEVVKATVKLALDAGAASVLVFDNPTGDARRCYDNSGIKAAVESIKDDRVVCAYADSRKFVPVDIKKGKSLKKYQFYKDALEADAYINVPVAKTHGSAKLTLALKNIMGAIGGQRGQIHWSLGQRIADLNTVIRPRLNILDATRVMVRNGPSGGDLADVKAMDTVAASADPVALDAWAARALFGMEPKDVDAIRLAAELGLGQIDLAKVKVIKA